MGQVEFSEKLDAQPITGTCDSAWGRNDCPNRAEWIIKHRNSKSFAIMCGPHKNGFVAEYSADKFDVLPFSFEKADELQKALP